MNYEIFLKTVCQNIKNKENIKIIEELYSKSLPNDIACIISNLAQTVFFEGDRFLRLLSFDEVLDAENDLNVHFIAKGIIPLIDLGDNDYLAFDLSKQSWCKFNIVDEIGFSYKNNLLDYHY